MAGPHAASGLGTGKELPARRPAAAQLRFQILSPATTVTLSGRETMMIRCTDVHGRENYPQGCSFSPDGTCILTSTSADGCFRVYETPFQRLEKDGQGEDSVTDGVQAQQQPQCWNASLRSNEGGCSPSSSSASYAWYPLMNSSQPITSFYATCRGHSTPIHLIDAYTSQLRASYRPYNAADEMEGPTVVEFSPDGRRVLGTGFRSDRTIAIFDVGIPGREGVIARLGKTRRSKDGQKGIPSALAFPKYGESGGGPNNVFAVGTYSPASIYIYDDRTNIPASEIVLHGGLAVVGHGRAFAKKKRRFEQMDTPDGEGDEDDNIFSSARARWFQSRARGGVTQLSWAPPLSTNPYLLYSASRRSNAVLSWDLRALSSLGTPVCGLQSFARDGDTNQRLEFDINLEGNTIFVGCGSSEGVVKIYDTTSGKLQNTLQVFDEDSGYRDAINGVSYLSYHGGSNNNGLLAVSVGSRTFDEPDDEVSNAERNGFLQLMVCK